MAITERVTIANVQMNDEYRIELRQTKKRMDYSMEQAEELAADLLRCVAQANVALADHLGAQRARAEQHGGGVW